MVKGRTLFKYKIKKGPLHKLPVILKIIMMILFSSLCFLLSLQLHIALILLLFIFAFICKITFWEQLTDLKPALYYSVFMYILSVISSITKISSDIFFNTSIFMPNQEYLLTALRLTFIIQLSALFFRTTSFMEIKECLNMIEHFIKRFFKIQSKSFFTDTISLFLMFIPDFFIVWSNVNLAWRARGGKPGIKKIKILIFVLISISFEKAALKARAIEARNIY